MGSGQGRHRETSPGTNPSEYVPFGQTGNKEHYRVRHHILNTDVGIIWYGLGTSMKICNNKIQMIDYQYCMIIHHHKIEQNTAADGDALFSASVHYLLYLTLLCES